MIIFDASVYTGGMHDQDAGSEDQDQGSEDQREGPWAEGRTITREDERWKESWRG
jgi:hypothetical protein